MIQRRFTHRYELAVRGDPVGARHARDCFVGMARSHKAWSAGAYDASNDTDFTCAHSA